MKLSTLNTHGQNRFTAAILQSSVSLCLALSVSIAHIESAQAAWWPGGGWGGGGWGGGWTRDTTAPTAPSKLSATAASTTPQIKLSWTASYDNVGVKAYTVYRGSTKVAEVSGTSTSFSDTGLSAETAYTYYLTAKDAAGNTSGASTSVSATTGASGDGGSGGGDGGSGGGDGGSGGGGGVSACDVNMSNFQLSGDPTSQSGATWTYNSTDSGISYNLKGILFEPSTGSGPFPGGIVSHGLGGKAPVETAKRFQEWGIVAIGTNYTHSSDSSGSPTGDSGASTANIQRAHKTWDILCGLGYVDMNRVVAHGHSMGAFVTAALVGSYPNDFIAASHTAGGVSDNKAPTWTSSALANGITAAYQIHHGDADSVVPIKDDQTLDGILADNGTVHEMITYPGYSHPDVRDDTNIMNTIKNWYTEHGLFN